MKKVTVFSVMAVLLLVVGAAVQPAQATCANSRGFSGGYVYTPGVCVDGAGDGPCDVSNAATTPALEGLFWHVGNYNPLEGPGNDSDGLPALDNWVSYDAAYLAYPPTIGGNWAADARIDGCIDIPQPGAPAAKCMAIALTDVDLDGKGAFVIMTKAADAGGDYLFGDGPFNLVTFPSLTILNTVRGVAGTNVQLQVQLEAAGLAAGLLLDTTGQCVGVGMGELIDGYRVRYQTVPRGGGVPNDPSAENWTDCLTGVTPIGQPVVCTVPTPNDVDVFVSYSMVGDGGFEAGVTGDPSTRVQGGPNLADPAPRIQIRQGGKTSVRTR